MKGMHHICRAQMDLLDAIKGIFAVDGKFPLRKCFSCTSRRCNLLSVANFDSVPSQNDKTHLIRLDGVKISLFGNSE